MKRKSVLVVCMMDSIHAARWLEQFTNLDIDFKIFSSSKFKKIHPAISALMKSQGRASYRLAIFGALSPIYGYLDFALYSFSSKILRRDSRKMALMRVLNRNKFDFVHALEIQHAGYLVSDVLSVVNQRPPFILTNWGSDIYFFSELDDHKQKLVKALRTATHYSAECHRDYLLARKLGFSGIELPCIPNAGGFSLPNMADISRASSRSQIVAKVYGGKFGRGDLVINALEKALEKSKSTTAFLYSVTDDLIPSVEILSEAFPERVRFSTRKDSLPHRDILEIFESSRVYLGASRSDGISTSFLEALVYGCYPIQTDTSCASEWVSMGAIASIVPQNVEALANALEEALSDDHLVDATQEANSDIAMRNLDRDVVRSIAISFYS